MAPKKRKTNNQRIDNYINAMTGFGHPAYDRHMATTFTSSVRDARYYELLYTENPVAHRIASLLPSESLRQGFRVTGLTSDDFAVVEAKYNDLGADLALITAQTYARAFGGGLVYIGVDDGRQPWEPLNPQTVRDVVYLETFTPDQLSVEAYYQDPLSPKFNRPEIYRVQRQGQTSIQIRVHESRTLRFDGVLTTERRRQSNGGWGDSVFVQLDETLSRWGAAVQGLSSALADADQAIFKLKDFTEMVRASAEGSDAINARLSMMARNRSGIRATVLDAEGEDFQYVSRTYSGYDTGLYALMYVVSAASGIPVTLLFGRSPAGLSATGESDIVFFYDTVKAHQTRVLAPQLRYLLSLIMSSKKGPLRGRVPSKWNLTFNPLRQPSALERADIRLKTAQADQIEITNGVISAQEAAMSHYGGDEYEPGIHLERDPSTTPLAAPSGAGSGDGGTSGDMEGDGQ